jgi:DNA polymerase epsilon subunit 1
MTARKTFGLVGNQNKGRRGRGGGTSGSTHFTGARRGYPQSNQRKSSGGNQHAGGASIDNPTDLDQRFEDLQIADEIDAKMGFARYMDGPERIGWLVNMKPVKLDAQKT